MQVVSTSRSSSRSEEINESSTGSFAMIELLFLDSYLRIWRLPRIAGSGTEDRAAL